MIYGILGGILTILVIILIIGKIQGKKFMREDSERIKKILREKYELDWPNDSCCFYREK